MIELGVRRRCFAEEIAAIANLKTERLVERWRPCPANSSCVLARG